MKIKILSLLLLLFLFLISQSFAQENESEKYNLLIEKFKNLEYGQWKSMKGQFKNADDSIYESLTQLLRKEETGEGTWRRIEWNQRRVAWILGDINTEKSADYLIRMFQDTTLNLWGRIDAVKVLGKNKTKKAVDIILTIFQDKKVDPQLRRSCARVMGDLKVEKAVSSLKNALDEHTNSLDMGVLYALGAIGSDEAVDALFYALGCVEYYNRITIYNNLRKLRPEKEIEFLLQALDDSYWGVREDAVKLLIKKGVSISDELAKIAENDKASVTLRWEAVRILGTLEEPELSELFMQSLADSDWKIRNEASVALSKIKSEKPIEPLIKMLSNKNSLVKEEAAWILGEIKAVKAVKPLIKLLEEKDIGWMAAISLGKIESEKALQLLIKALQNDNIKKRRAAAWALEKLKCKKSVPALKKALMDEDEDVRSLAALALKNFNIPF